MGKTCFDCGQSLGWGETKHSSKFLKEEGEVIGIQDEIVDKMDEKDNFCTVCFGKFQARYALEYYKHLETIMGSKEFENWKKSDHIVIQVINSQPGLLQSSNEKDVPLSTNEISSKTNSNTKTIVQNTLNVTSAAQLRALTSSQHDMFKAQWDKNGIVQYKNDRITILKRVVGQQVQFIVAYDKVTEEGYRLMAIDEGITASGSGFSGGASAFFYFQKMDYVK